MSLKTKETKQGPASATVNPFHGATLCEVPPPPLSSAGAPVKRVSRALPNSVGAGHRLTPSEESELRWYFFEADAPSLQCCLGTLSASGGVVIGTPREPGYIEDRDLDRGRRYDRIQKRIRRMPYDEVRILHRYVGHVYDDRYPMIRSVFGILSTTVTGSMTESEIERLEYATLSTSDRILSEKRRALISETRIAAECALGRAVRAWRGTAPQRER